MVQPVVTSQAAAHFWNACAEGRYELQRCTDCHSYRYPPRRVCPNCLSRAAEWQQSEGRGSVYTFSIVERGPSEAFDAMTPYIVALIDLEEGVRVLSNIVGCNPADVRIGMPVEVTLEPVNGSALPRFKMSGQSG